MVESMKKVAKMDQELTVEERNLLSVAYKNLIGARRASWRIVTNIESKEESKSENSKLALTKKYRSQVCLNVVFLLINKTSSFFRLKRNYVISVKIFSIYLIKIFYLMLHQVKAKFFI
jgi:hypothetical protein